MSKFVSGNVIKTAYGSIEIVTNVRANGYVDTIFVKHSNSGAVHSPIDLVELEDCACEEDDCYYCETGTKKERIRYGMESAELLAKTVSEWITKVLLGGFDII